MTEQHFVRALAAAVLMLAGVVLVSGPVMAQVYKTVDADGNVTYTDQPPGPGAEPIELRELSVVERPEYKPTRSQQAEAAAAEGAENPREALRQLQQQYRDFRLVSPTPEQSFWGTSNTATVAWDTNAALQDGMKVRIYLDDQAATTTTQSLFATPRLDRGEHTVRAELLDVNDQVVAMAGPVTFFIHQQTVNNSPANRPRPTPRGG